MTAVAQAGDTILITLDRMLSDEEYEILRERLIPLREATGVKIAIMDGVTSATVIKAPERDVNGAPL